MPMQKNQEYSGTVISLGTMGEGIVKVGEEVAFVPSCLPQEQVNFRVLANKGGVAYGKVLTVKNPSAHRVTPKCPVCEQCGGCQLQHMDEKLQLQFKHDLVANSLAKIGGIQTDVSATVSGQKPFGYRNKLALPIGVNERGETVIGFYAERSHRIVPISACAIQADWAKDVIELTHAFIKVSGLSGYNELSKKGDLRHIVVRKVGQNYLVVLVVKKPINAQKFYAMLKERLGTCTLWLNVNAGTGNGLFTPDMRLVGGAPYYTATDCGITFQAGANTFLQVNDDVRTKLYEAVIKEANDPDAVVLDLYSGGGLLTAMLAKNAKAAYGVEIVPEASACADSLKEMNGLSQKMHNVCGKVEDKIAEIFAATQGAKRIVVCDPPRKGMERSVLYSLLKNQPDKIILISCNPATLARDLGILCGTLTDRNGSLVKTNSLQARDVTLNNLNSVSTDTAPLNKANATDAPASDNAVISPYTIQSVTPFDMFPQTKHVETLVLLCRQ